MEVEIRRLRHVDAVARHQSFARAARALQMSQPALSRSIQELEGRLASKLFARKPRRVELTDVGRIFLERAREVLARADDLTRGLDGQGRSHATLRVGAGIYPAELVLGRTCARFVGAHPTVALEVASGSWADLMRPLHERELDLVVADTRAAEEDPELAIEPLAERQGHLVVRAGHPLLARESVALRDVVRYHVVASTRLTAPLLEPMLRARAELAPDVAAPTAIPSIGCESVSMMRVIALESDAVAILPLTLAAAELARSTLRVLPLPVPWLRGRFGAIRVARRVSSPAAQAFLRILRAVDAEVTAEEERVAASLAAAAPPARAQRARARRAPSARAQG
jgi:DNA-binding transcriptional LysR family regulator